MVGRRPAVWGEAARPLRSLVLSHGSVVPVVRPAGVAVGRFRSMRRMIKVHRLNGEPFLVNAELVRYVESRPDTFITMTTGDRLVVQESMDEVLRLVVEYQRHKHLVPPPTPLGTG